VITDAHGTPLAVSLTGGNRHDVTELMALVDAIPAVTGCRGRPRQRPDVLYADRAYDYNKYRRLLRGKGISTRIARRGVAHGSGLGAFRWVVERTIAWYHGFRRLRTRWERRADIHEAFLGLATCIITHRRLTQFC
jgi:transposase